MTMNPNPNVFEEAARETVELGNRIAEKYRDSDIWDVGDGLVTGAIQYWLYSRQPCGDPLCEDCASLSTADARLAELLKLVRQFAEESEYFHAPTDSNAGRA